jgi:hypothetical protein
MEDRESYEAVMYCSTTGWAFGPVMPTIEIAEAFLRYLGNTDARTLSDPDLETKYLEFLRRDVCECNTVRETECFACKFHEELRDGMHYDRDGATEKCRVEPIQDGQRFVCADCVRDHQRKHMARETQLLKGWRTNAK